MIRRAAIAVTLALAAGVLASTPSPIAAAPGDCAPSPAGTGRESEIDHGLYAPATGVVRAIMIFVDFPNAVATEPTSDLADVLLPAADWYAASSYGHLDLQITTVDRWFRMPKDDDQYGFGVGFSFETHHRYIGDAVAAADPLVDFGGYDFLYVVPSMAADDIYYSPAFTAYPGGGVTADGNELRLGATFGQDIHGWGFRVLNHETGHLFGLPDLYSFDYGSDIHRYVGGWDLMGFISGPAPDHLGWHKLLLGWLDASDVVCVDTAGTVEVTLAPLGAADGVRLAVLPLPGDTHFVLEYRDGTGLDVEACSTGVLAYRVDQAGETGEGPVAVVDARPSGGPDGVCHELDDAAITTESGPISLGGEYRVEVVSTGATAVVQVTRGSTPSQPPQDEPTPNEDLEGRELAVDPWSADPAVTPRLGSDDPVETALAISTARFADERAGHVVLARDDAFPDALAGTPLLGEGPLLLTHTASLRDDVAAEIDRVLPGGGRVYLLGGTAALSQGVEDDLVADGWDVVRLWGQSRFDTAVAIADEVAARYPAAAGTVLVARSHGTSGNPTAGWADSVTGGAFAAAARHPVVLSDSGFLSPQAARFLGGRERAVLLGGTAALADRVADEAATHVDRVDRVSGAGRDATAVDIMTDLWGRSGGSGRFTIVNGYDEVGWAFGLPAAGLAADALAPLLPVASGVVPGATEAALSSCGDKQVDTLVVGGAGVVSEPTRGAVEARDGRAC